MHEPAGVVEILVKIPQNRGILRRVSEYPPKMKIVRESKSESFRIIPQNENCQRVQIREFKNTPPNENCQRVQIRKFHNTPPKKNGKNFRFQTSE